MQGRALAVASLLLLLLVARSTSLAASIKPPPPASSSEWTDRFDRHFRKYSKRYFGPGFNWHWFKAQAIAESTLNPSARSSTGARGLMQILPSTYEEIRASNPYFARIDEPRWNIAAGIYYDRMLYERWRVPPPQENRLSFTFASYNAGYGGILRAVKRAAKAGLGGERWKEIAPHAPTETRRYVDRIHGLMEGASR